MPSPYKVGQVVSIDDGRSGTIRFIGPTSFREGEWIGIELSDDSGKNDGSVQGQRYFDCPDGRGLFLQAPKIERILEQPKPVPKKPATRPGSISSRPGASVAAPTSTASKRQSVVANGLKRNSILDPTAAKRQSINAASPTPARGTSATTTSSSRTSVRPASKTTSSAATSSPSKPATSTSTTTRRTQTSGLAASRTATTSSPAKPSSTRPSLAAPRLARSTATSGSTSTRTSANRSSISSRTATRPVSTTSIRSVPEEKSPAQDEGQVSKDVPIEEDDEENDQNGVAPEPNGVQDTDDVSGESYKAEESEPEVSERTNGMNGHAKEPTRLNPSGNAPVPKAASPNVTSKTGPRASPTTRPVAGATPPIQSRSKREEELTKAIELLERKRDEDREKLGKFERVMAEKDRYASVIEKLQTKYQPQAKELQEKTQRLEALESEIARLKDAQEEQDAVLEEAALDRETAEEIAETLRTELDEIKVKAEELEFELETLREENEELGKEMTPEERTSKGWLQMERENQRLRDALLRLRDMTKEQESELQEEVGRLEADLEGFKNLKEEHEITSERLKQSEVDLAELKDQLEATREGEGMLEELTDKNLALNEQIEELKLSIEHLEDIRDLNDEMELAHVENERQMQDELDSRDMIIGENDKLHQQQEEKLASYEYTITRFRELVANLQSHIEEMKATKQISEVESEELSSRSKAMADLNLRLQNSAMKAQVKTVDFELARLEAQEAVEHLSISTMFLTDGYQADKESILAYLRFKRMHFKAELLRGFFKERQAEAVAQPITETSFVWSEIIDSFAWIAGTAMRFVQHISSCTIEQFGKYSAALYELDPIEKALNRYIEGWRKNDYKERTMAEELERSILLLTHLAEVHIDEDPASFAEDVAMRTSVIQSRLENVSVLVSLVSRLVSDRMKLIPDDAEESEMSSFTEILAVLEKLTSLSRTSRLVAGKASNAVQDLRERSMALDTDTLDAFEKPQKHVYDVVRFCKAVGERFFEAFENQDKEGASPQSAVESALSSLKLLPFTDRQDRSPLIVLQSRLQTATEDLNKLLSVASELSNASEFHRGQAPWVIRGDALKSSKKTTASAEEDNRRLRDDMKERLTQLRIRDQTVEEQNVKIELLESRMKDANAKANRINELQGLLDTGRKREKELAAAVEAQLRTAQNMQVDRDRWKQVADEAKAAGARDAKRAQYDRPGGTAKEMDALRRQIRSLQGAVRYLREEGSKGQTSKEQSPENLDWLAQPLFTHRLPAVKERRAAHERLLQEGGSVYTTLIDLAASMSPVDLRDLPENKLAWRPAKQKTSWALARQMQQWEAYRSSKSSYIVRAKATLASMPKTLDTTVHPRRLITDAVDSVGMNRAPPNSAGFSDENFEDARSEVVIES